MVTYKVLEQCTDRIWWIVLPIEVSITGGGLLGVSRSGLCKG